MKTTRFLSTAICLATAFTLFFACSSDSPSGPSNAESSPSQKPSSSSVYTSPPPSSSSRKPSSSSVYIAPTMEEACNSYWMQAINQIANQCTNATISISKAPSPSQTYGYDCSLTQANINAAWKEVCPQTPPSTCDLACAQQVASSAGANLQSSSFCNAVAKCGTTCKANYSWCR